MSTPRSELMTYQCIVADPPWQQTMTGSYKNPGNHRPAVLPYSTMSLEQIKAMLICDLAAEAAHLWLWTTNQYLAAGFDVMESWGFKYLAPIHWIKPSGTGNWFVHRTQTILFGYKDKCRFPLARYKPNWFQANPGRHSAKPEQSYALIEQVSPGPRLELFARAARPGWHVWGNAVVSDVRIAV